MLPEYFVIFGAIIGLVGSLHYLRDVIKGRVKPNRVTWFLWALAPLLAFSAELGEGVGLRSLMTFMAGFSPLMIFIASFVNKKSYWKLTKLDISCGIISVLGLVLWLITKEGFYAITFSIIADAVAALPTIIKSYKNPESENYKAFLGGGISAVIALLTIDEWYYANWGFPVYILSICVLFVLLIKYKIGLKISSKVS